MAKTRRRTLEEQSVLIYMQPGETYAGAKARLDAMWEAGTHPAQHILSKRERRQLRRMERAAA